jgi:deazaflavin-dependent oxidoreductase (nitroreductase family)
MAKRVKELSVPTGFARILYRMPIWLYQNGLGWLLGNRFLMIHHTGRKSGLPRQAVVEVVRHDEETDTFIVAVGFGKKTNWYLNLLAQPEAEIQVGRRKIDVSARPLSEVDGGMEMLTYTRHNQFLARQLSKFMGFEVDGSEEDYREMGEMMTFMALEPR